MMLNSVIPLTQSISLQLLCESHQDKPIIRMCSEENCPLNPFFCTDCVNQQQNHINVCHRNIFDNQTAINKICQKLEHVAPNSVFGKYRDYFREYQSGERENIQLFANFIKEQKSKLTDDVNLIKKIINEKIDQYKNELMERMDEQITAYTQNFNLLRQLFDDTLGNKYNRIMKYCKPNQLTKKLNQLGEVPKASEFIREIKNDYRSFYKSQMDQKTEAFSLKLQELFLLLNSQSVQPPTYKQNEFNQHTLIQIKHSLDQLMKKLQDLVQRNIWHFPIKNFEKLLESHSSMVQSVKIPPKKVESPLDFLAFHGSTNIVSTIPLRRFDRLDTKYVPSGEDENCVTAMNLLGDRMIVYALSDNTIRFKPLKEDEIHSEYEPMALKQQVYSIEVLKYENSEDSDGMQKSSIRLYKRSNQQDENFKTKISYILVVGCEESVKVWKVFLHYGQSQNQVEILRFHNYKPAGLLRCISIMDCLDNRTFVGGDWEGQLFVFDTKANQCSLRSDSQQQIIIQISMICKPSSDPSRVVRLASATKCDMEMGGVTIWVLTYEDRKPKTFMMEKRIPVGKVTRILSLKLQPSILVIVDQDNKVQLWDTERNHSIKTLNGGESAIMDMFSIEFQNDQNSITLGFLNSSTFRLVDSNETLLAQFPAEDFGCAKCRQTFASMRILGFQYKENILCFVYPRHIHSCKHDTNINEDRCSLKSCFNIQMIKVNHFNV